MPERKRIGVEVDAQLWEEFRDDVKERKGRVSGVLSVELETAIRQYIYDGGTASVEERLSRIENKLDAVGVADADGGTTVENPNTHARADVPDAKPAVNQPRAEKAAWLVDEMGIGSGAKVPRDAIEAKIEQEYNLGDRSVDPLVEAVADRIRNMDTGE